MGKWGSPAPLPQKGLATKLYANLFKDFICPCSLLHLYISLYKD